MKQMENFSENHKGDENHLRLLSAHCGLLHRGFSTDFLIQRLTRMVEEGRKSVLAGL